VIFNLKHPRADFRVAFLVVLVLIPVSFSCLLSHNVLLAALVFVVSNTGGGRRDGSENDGGEGEGAVRGWGLLVGGWVGGWVIRGGEGGMDVRGGEKR